MSLVALDVCGARPIPAELFGQNLEHTRSAVQGGLSAQLVRNRKFAGKPQRNGVAMMWEAYGTKALYDHSDMAVNRHAAKSRMVRYNEQHSQQFARPEIASAKFKVVFCHIPLFADPASEDYPHDGVKIDPNDFAYWSRECGELWGPILSKAGVKLVVCGHTHQFRFYPSTADRPWAQIVGGGPELGVVRGKPDTGRFPTVIEGFAENGKLRLVVHDVFSNRVVLDKYL